MLEPGEQINAIFWLLVAAVALVPLIIFSISYKRIKNKRILLTTFAFGLFFLKALLLSMKLVIPEAQDDLWQYDDETWWTVAAMLDVMIIGLITASLVLRNGKKKKK